jgi:hypothetical protein
MRDRVDACCKVVRHCDCFVKHYNMTGKSSLGGESELSQKIDMCYIMSLE